MLNPGDRVVVAVSGGPDSVCLLSILQALGGNLGLDLHIAHLDHMFRGKESADEARSVERLAKRLGLPATIDAFDVPAYCRGRGLSPQEGARQARYGFLRQVARDTGASRIATGHTADDQAETCLMRLLRGAGISGLSAIPPVREEIIRPLIEVTRDEITEYLRINGLEFATDPSNAKPVYTRNRIRLEVLPVLKRFNPRIARTLAAETALLRDENTAMEAYLDTIAKNILLRQEDALFVKRDLFENLLPALRRRLLRRIVAITGDRPGALSLDQTNEALSFMQNAQTGRSMNLTPALSVTREYDRFIFSSRTEHPGASRTLVVPGAIRVPELGVEVETLILDRTTQGNHLPAFRSPESSHSPDALSEAGREAPENYRWQARFDYAKIMPPFVVRSRKPGDWFCPSGMAGRSQKLQDYFVNEKIPRRRRNGIPLLCGGENILWVVGHRTDERFLAGPETERVLFIRVGSILP